MTVSKKSGIISKNVRAKTVLENLGSDNLDLGLLAIGSSHSWEVSIDETTTGSDRWFVQIEGPSFCFKFEIPSLEVVHKAIQFLTTRSAAAWSQSRDTLLIGIQGQTPVALRRDDEHSDRFFLVVGCETSPMVMATIAGTNLAAIMEALQQVEAELKDE